MSNLLKAIADQERDQEIAENKEYLTSLAKQIQTTQAYGPAFDARRWLETNREKILRNRNLIDLLG